MKIASILENQKIEKRIAITPEIAKKYISIGIEVSLCENYANHLGIKDKEYKELGVLILNDEKEIKTQILVNCASNEYFNVIKPNVLSLKVITPVFLERKDGKEKIISFYAKNARGAMARFIIQNRVLDEADLKKFNLNGYLFYPEKSNDDQIVFIRNVS